MHPSADTIDLAGEWRFALDPDDIGVSEQWYARTFSQSVYLPGPRRSRVMVRCVCRYQMDGVNP